MTDVARLAGVSEMTVSNAYRRPDRVSESTRKRVLEAGKRLGYVLNEIAGNLASGRSKVIVAVIPSLSSSYFHETLQGTMDELREHDYQLMLADAGYGSQDEQRAVDALLRRRPDGVVLTGTRHTRKTATMLRATGMPVVETWEIQGPFIDMGVGFANSDAASLLTELVIAKGHREIGFIDHPLSMVKRHRQRRDGIRSALERAGLSSDRVAHVPEVMGFRGGRIGMTELLESWPQITAAIAATDVYAAGAVFECQRRRLKVPRDMAICGFGNAEVGRELMPSLTTIDTRSYEMGRIAARLLLDKLAGRNPQTTVVDVGFAAIERESL